ncbi:dolichyl-phosphate-mannose--protein mannosyltransferase [Streptomyces benahoarensis]|uniref:Polyprenol-phosphate-mannose--protein mannosyltransferase n=1 Tax=Streptomyces benahoarensis TaxID=2595054 RepID=A0A553ZK31_9ACTN|nr:phospholipid carrier-dependent glycosyltransferase [Streptomyces benahoarensis]TSB26669.1 phospholipid carrier-dependent glycosyltransferase [Streptomyces benahoarensis]TSB41839.1 phospholipid carrier-dependent glycosyltransferase [Streptomyces benahoarensis]
MGRVTSDTATDAVARSADQPDRRPPAWQCRLRRFGYAGGPRPDVRTRLVPPFPKPGTRLWELCGANPLLAARLARASGWAGPLLVTLLAGVLRFWNLGSPDKVIFDETYYPKDAWSLLQFGYEGTWDKHANDALVGHPARILLHSDPSYVVHPPMGKWLIAVGEWAFGMNPFGWRFMVALLGTLSVLLVCRIGRRLLRSTALGCLAGALLAVDGLHFVMSRTALLDLIVMFWVLAAFGALLLDRDHARARLAAALPVDAEGQAHPDGTVGDRLRLGWRPWRITAGVCLGLASATKWNGLYFLAAFALMSVVWDIGARRTAGARRPVRSVLRRDVVPAFGATVVVAVATYLASWSGWFATKGGYYREWATTPEGRTGAWTWLPDWLRSLWHYQTEVYAFHTGLTTPHTYQSNPWSWLVLGRPVSYFYEDPKAGHDGCTAAEGCAREVLAIGTPLLWWAACFALAYVLYRWAFKRDWRAGAVVCGVAAGYLPWFLYQERTIFLFYAVVFVPFLCLALAIMIGAIIGPPGSSERRRTLGAVGAGVLVLLIVWNFVYFYPIYTGLPIPKSDWHRRMWFDTWV